MKKKTAVIASIVTLLTMASVPAGYAHATEESWSKVIYPGVYIEDTDVSGKTFEEARALIIEKYGLPLLSKKINITANNKIYTIDFGRIKAKYNIEQTAAAAYNYGKEENIINKYRLIKSPEKKEFRLVLSYNAELVDEIINTIEKDVNKEAVPAKIRVNSGRVSIIPEVKGRRLQKDSLRAAVISKIDGEPVTEAVKLEAPVEIIEPAITAEKLSVINSKASSFSTSFETSTANRINNIQLAVKSINGTLLMPEDTFSFNKIVGERTKARGYKEAGVIIGDKIESGLGGGICQVSSTLYNVVLKANLTSLERRNHTLPLSYIGKGLDATVDWGNIDYKFKNTLNYPVYIEGYVRNNNIYFNIYSNEKLTRRTYEMTADVIKVVEPTIKYIDDPNMNKGEEKIVKKASTGYKMKVYRKTYEGNTLINTELISSDTYKVVNGEIRRGIK